MWHSCGNFKNIVGFLSRQLARWSDRWLTWLVTAAFLQKLILSQPFAASPRIPCIPCCCSLNTRPTFKLNFRNRLSPSCPSFSSLYKPEAVHYHISKLHLSNTPPITPSQRSEGKMEPGGWWGLGAEKEHSVPEKCSTGSLLLSTNRLLMGWWDHTVWRLWLVSVSFRRPAGRMVSWIKAYCIWLLSVSYIWLVKSGLVGCAAYKTQQFSYKEIGMNLKHHFEFPWANKSVNVHHSKHGNAGPFNY